MSSVQTVLGIDPGLADTGWGIVQLVDGNTLRSLDYGSIKTKPTQTSAERLVKLYTELTEIIHRYQPKTVAIEQLFFGKNAKTAMVVGEARGVVIVTIGLQELNYKQFTPPAIKTALTGHGNADKVQIQNMVKVLLNLDKIPEPNHAADALAVAITALITKEW